MKMRPPHWLPWLGPAFAGLAAGTTANRWPEGGFWGILLIALICGFAPIVIYRVWKQLHHRR